MTMNQLERKGLMDMIYDKINNRFKKGGIRLEQYTDAYDLIMKMYNDNVQAAAKKFLNKIISEQEINQKNKDIKLLENATCISKRPEFVNDSTLDPIERFNICKKAVDLISATQLERDTLKKTSMFCDVIENKATEKTLDEYDYYRSKAFFYALPNFYKRKFFLEFYRSNVIETKDLIEMFVRFVETHKKYRK